MVVLFFYMYLIQYASVAAVVAMSLSLVLASVPVTLPMVTKMTLSTGGKEMVSSGGSSTKE